MSSMKVLLSLASMSQGFARKLAPAMFARAPRCTPAAYPKSKLCSRGKVKQLL